MAQKKRAIGDRQTAIEPDLIPSPIDAVWRILRAALKEGRALGQADIVSRVNEGRVRPVDTETVRRFLMALERAGAATRSAARGRGLWRLVADKFGDRGETTPVVNNGLASFGTPSLEQRVWKAARVMKRFDLVEISRAASGEPGAIARYLGLLVAGGWCREDGSAVRWRFIEANYTGPKAPVMTVAYGFLDRNTDRAESFGRPEHVEV